MKLYKLRDKLETIIENYVNCDTKQDEAIELINKIIKQAKKECVRHEHC